MSAGGITVTHPNTTQYTGDIKQIVWTDGANIQHSIKQVYWSPDGVNAYLVWPKPTAKKLINDSTQDQYLMVKYKPASNINVSKVAVLVDPSGNGNGSDCLVIVNDQGLLIYSGKNNSQESTAADTTLYEYTGYKRTRTFNSSVTLYAGKTYWIHYHFSDCRNHRGAYFNNTQGKYKNFGNFDFVTFGGYDHYPSLSNLDFTGNVINVTAESSNANLNIQVNDILTNSSANDLIGNIVYQENKLGHRTNNCIGTYYGMIEGDNDNKPTVSQLNDIPIGNIFLLYSTHYHGSLWICKRKDGDISSSVDNGYDVLCNENTAFPHNENSQEVPGILIDYYMQKNSFIQYYDNGAGASYWNATPSSDKTFYLEINDTEKSDDAERA